MQQLQHIRNGVVHSASLPDTLNERRKAESLIAGLPGITCTEFGFDLGREFIAAVFAITNDFLREMSAAVGQANERVKRFENEV
jgi:hypothetical protein